MGLSHSVTRFSAGRNDAECNRAVYLSQDKAVREFRWRHELCYFSDVLPFFCALPVMKMHEASEWLYWVCAWNPFSHGVELIRFALYQQGNSEALIIVLLVTMAASILAVRGFQPQQGMGKR